MMWMRRWEGWCRFGGLLSWVVQFIGVAAKSGDTLLAGFVMFSIVVLAWLVFWGYTYTGNVLDGRDE